LRKQLGARLQRGGCAGGCLLLLGIMLGPPPALAAERARDLSPAAVARMGLEELMAVDISITTVAGVPRDRADTPSAVSVISAEDIRRSGHRSLSETLRLVPGMLVARSTSYTSRVGARGFSGGLANKNQVLIDGRSVWDPLFGGVFWDVRDVIFEDIDRIEVIRGPGATLWGANAMNGVINVISRSAQDTQGWYVTGGGGTYEQGFGAARYGGRLAEDAWFRVHARYVNRDSFVDADGRSTGDDWSLLRAGFRLDALVEKDLAVTVQGDAYGAPTMGEIVNVPVAPGEVEAQTGERRARGGNLLARVGREHRPGDGWSLQAYYDGSRRRQSAGLELDRDTFDLDYRRFLPWGEGHEFIGGFGLNHTTDRTEAGPTLSFDPSGRSLTTASGFLQSTFALRPTWFAMLGSKFEHNDYTGFEFQPGVRLWHVPSERHTFWGAVSRPVRIPTRTEQDAFFVLGLAEAPAPGEPFVPIGVMGGDDLDAERMISYELGHRFRPSRRFIVETSVFYSDYSQLIFVSAPLIGTRFNNLGHGSAHGGEVEINWEATENWRLAAGYGYTKVDVRGPVLRFEEGTHPRHIAQLRSHFDVTPELEFNALLYYVDALPQPGVPSYLRLDAGVTWRATRSFELAAWGQNLLHSSHQEASFREFERGFYVRGTLRF
jgi:iron complex outermembrane recepter protein